MPEAAVPGSVRLKWAVLVVGAASCALVAWFWLGGRPGRLCDQAISDRAFKDAVVACKAAFEHHREGRFAAATAMGHLGLGQIDDALRWAEEPAARDLPRARRVRGVVLKSRGEPEQATAELQAALALALEQGDAAEAARSAHALAGLKWEDGRYSESYEAIEISVRQAERAEDGPALALAELARGDVFSMLGDGQRADVHYRRGFEAAARWPSDQAYAAVKLGDAYEKRGEYALAAEYSAQALELARRVGNEGVAIAAQINLSNALISSGDLAAAQKHLDELPADVQADWDVQFLRARVALAKDEVPAALRLLEQVQAAELDAEARWMVASVHGEALLRARRGEEAAQAWQRAVAEVETLIAAEPEYQAWVAARRRRPFDHLFAWYARAGRAAEAWAVVARYARAEALSFAAGHDEDPRRMLSAAEALKRAAADVSKGEGAPDVLDDGRELMLLHEAGGTLWAGSRRGESVTIVAAGSADRIDPLLHRLLGDPGDTEAAAELGAALWSAAAVSASETPLYVVSTGRLRRLALSALRHQGRSWIELRPLARLSTLEALAGNEGRFEGPPIIAGDPRGDLADAREEARWVASQLGAPAQLGAAATREAVLGTQRASVLHLATHATVRLEGTALLMADGEVAAHEVLARRPTARVVVLASCASAVGREVAGADSLTTAFLKAGSGAVVGTLRTVPDASARELVRAFYQHGGASDPVKALRSAQVELAKRTPVEVWSAFVVSVGPSLQPAVARK